MTTDQHILGHFYEPLPYYGGRVLKYQGQATPANHDWMMARDGMVCLPERIADRITADTHVPFIQEAQP